MTDSVTFDQNNMVGGEVMEVMMTGGDGGEMNEDTLAQVVNMLQMEGQLTGGNHTIIIRQPGSSEIQMIQTTSNGGELIVSKASEAEIQALQAGNGILENVGQDILENQQGQVVMMDEGGNLVEGVVQMQGEESQDASGEVMQLTPDGQLQAIPNTHSSNLINAAKNGILESSEILDGLVQMDGIETQGLIDTALQANDSIQIPSTKPITISTTTGKPKPQRTAGINGEVVSIKINTGLLRKKETKPVGPSPKNVIKISTVTGQQKFQPPKFHKCEACAINFVSKVAYMNHMDNCPSKRRSQSFLNNRNNETYTCVFCETKFTSRLVLMQHVRTCDKAKSSKNLSTNSKLKVTTSESKLKLPGNSSNFANDKNKNDMRKSKKNSMNLKDAKGKLDWKKESFLDPEDEPFENERDVEDSDDADEKDIVYDDEDDDINEDELMEEMENLEETVASKKSQKHLGPVIVKGMFKCRDCERTFSKESQYNRHVKACTNSPLTTSRNEKDAELQANAIPVSAGEALHSNLTGKRKRGRPFSKDYGNEDGSSPAKKRMLGPKIVAINPKKVGPVRGRPRFVNFSDNESDEEIFNYLSGGSQLKKDVYGRKNSKMVDKTFKKSEVYTTSSSLNKIVKINSTDSSVKQTGKAMLSKINKGKYNKFFKETPFCGLCGDKFKTSEELSLHTQISHSEDLLNLRDSLDGKGNMSSIKCPLCDLHFLSPQVLLLHMVAFHSRDLKSVEYELEAQNLSLVCPFCNELSFTQELLKEHMATMHLDKLINKPSTSVSPMAIDVHAFIKEKNNGSMLPTGKLLTKKERVLCPECGLFFFKSYFEHHKCAAETYSTSARKFICSEAQCCELSFYKLIHLLTHLQQVHDNSLIYETETFDSLTQYLEWLKKEETQTKRKFTKALQRMKQGKLSTVWICHRFHNAMKDTSSNAVNSDHNVKLDRLSHCYSRIHTETSYNISTSRYDGKTTIKYFPNHRHLSENEHSDVKTAPALPTISSLEEKQTSSVLGFIPEQTAFSNAAELKQLLEDDDDFDKQKRKSVDSNFDAQQLARFEVLERETSTTTAKEEEMIGNVFESAFPKADNDGLDGANELMGQGETLQQAVVAEGEEANSLSKLADKIIEEESLPSSELSGEKLVAKESKEDSGLVSLSDTELLLEKMLGEHDGEGSSVVAMETSEESGTPPVGMALAPTEAKITDVDMLEAFGDCITPEESSNPSTTTTTSTTQQSSVSSEQPEEAEPDVGQTTEVALESEFVVGHESEGEVAGEVGVGEDVPMEGDTPQLEEQDSNILSEDIPPIKGESPALSEDVIPPIGEDESPALGQDDSAPIGDDNSPALGQNDTPQMVEDNTLGGEVGIPSAGEDSTAVAEEESEIEEENTYVLPADMEEWNKLFELVAAQMSSGNIIEEEKDEAKQLLSYEDSIMSIDVEKQIEVFNRLCTLANVEMS